MIRPNPVLVARRVAEVGMLRTAVLMAATLVCVSCALLGPEAPTLQADISPSQLRFFAGGDNHVRLYLTLINSTHTVIDPKLETSELLVNGQVLKESRLICRAALDDRFLHGLPSGRRLRLVYEMKTPLRKAGVYILVWRGESFESIPVRIAVLNAPQAL